MNNKQTLYNKPNDRIRLYLVIVFCLIAIFKSGSRDINKLPEGNDTPVFEYSFNNVKGRTWVSLISNFSLYSSDYAGRDSGYPILMKASQIINGDFRFFMYLTAFIFIVPLGILFYKYINSILGLILAFLIFFALFSNIINSFMRQAIALSIELYALRFIYSRKIVKYFISIIFAISIHSSAIIALPLYFLPRINQSKKWLLVAICISPILVLFSRMILSSFLIGSVYEGYVDDDAMRPINYVTFVVLISLLAFFEYNRIKSVCQHELLLSGAMASMFLLPIVFMGGTMLRISYYYVILLIPLLSVIIDNFKMRENTRRLVYLVLICFFSFFAFR